MLQLLVSWLLPVNSCFLLDCLMQEITSELPLCKAGSNRLQRRHPFTDSISVSKGILILHGSNRLLLGFPRLKELIEQTSFVRAIHFLGLSATQETCSQPWLLSNIIDTTTGNVPVPMKEFVVLERSGLRIGLIGLVEEYVFPPVMDVLADAVRIRDWIVTITGWPETFQHRDMEAVGKNLSVLLRDPNGDYKCDLIIALTHSRCVGGHLLLI